MKKKKHDARKYLIIAISAIVPLTLAVLLTLFLVGHSPVDRVYDLVALLVSSGALAISVVASLDAKKQRVETEKIQSEIHEAIRELRHIDRENDKILNEIVKDEKIDIELTQKIEEIEEAIEDK